MATNVVDQRSSHPILGAFWMIWDNMGNVIGRRGSEEGDVLRIPANTLVTRK